METAEGVVVSSKYDEMVELIKKLVLITGSLTQGHVHITLFRFEDEVYNEWTQGVDEVAKVNLEKPLLIRDPQSSLISVNFDPQLVALLREVKYLEQRDSTEQEIPQSAAAIFSQHETYRKFLQVRLTSLNKYIIHTSCLPLCVYTLCFHDVVVVVQNLDVTVTLYNQVRESILDVEYPLIEFQLSDIDKQLERAISQLNWTSDGMSPHSLEGTLNQ